MTDGFATYSFLPWLRRGMGTEITRADGTLTGAARADVPITLVIDAGGDEREVTAELALYGPGEIAGIDPRIVIQTIPKAGEADAEPSELPMVELDQPDFPWRYTPATHDAKMRLRPWLVLAVLAAEEILEDIPAGTDGSLPAITVASAAALPLLDQSWAWAHVQIEGFDPATETVEEIVRDEPLRVRSRLLAPRHLLPRTAYTAVLVPTFERGRRAGLREPLGDDVDGLAPAWAPGANQVRLPVYYRWSFQTGRQGDFEQLAQRLRARPVGPDVGVRDLDVADPDPALPPASRTPVAMQGALVSPAAAPGRWEGRQREAFTNALAAMLNGPADALAGEGGQRTVAPPLWGRWHAARDRLDPAIAGFGAEPKPAGQGIELPGSWPPDVGLPDHGLPDGDLPGTELHLPELVPPELRPLWFHELNGDPRLRATAGLGAALVRRHDQQLMAAAWEQVAGIIAANEALRHAQLAREAGAKVHANHLAKLDDATFLEVSAPMHARFIATSPSTTVHQALRVSPVPPGALDGQLRSILRPGTAVSRQRPGDRPPGHLLARLNRGELRAGRPASALEGMLTLDVVFREEPEATPGGASPSRRPGPAGTVEPRSRRADERGRDAGRGPLDARPGPAESGPSLGRTVAGFEPHDLEPAPGWHPGVAGGLVGAGGSWHRPVPVGGDPRSDPLAAVAVERFQQAFNDLATELSRPPAEGPVRQAADLPGLAENLRIQMDPRLTIVAGIGHRLTIGKWVTWEAADPLEPVMVAPEFDRPMSEPLRVLGQEWLLSGAGSILPNTVTLVVANQRFIEAFVVGLNDEMGRELLYHEFPTDQRGTCFRQFWDSRGHVATGGGRPDPEAMRDVLPIHTWDQLHGLGGNTGRTPPPPDNSVVLLVKGELLRRFPNTIVYAVETALGEDGERTLGTEERYPIFSGRLDPDISFFGFDLVEGDVRGATGPGSETSEDQGWYFVLQEHPTEPRFGLDADNRAYGAKPTTWADLNWAHTAASKEELAALGYLDLDADLPDTTAVVPGAGEPALAWHATTGRGAKGANGSDLAWITFQRPFRVAIHGSDMLPQAGS